MLACMVDDDDDDDDGEPMIKHESERFTLYHADAADVLDTLDAKFRRTGSSGRADFARDRSCPRSQTTAETTTRSAWSRLTSSTRSCRFDT